MAPQSYLIREKPASVSPEVASIIAECDRLAVRRRNTEVISNIDVVESYVIAVDPQSASQIVTGRSGQGSRVGKHGLVLTVVHDIGSVAINLSKINFRGNIAMTSNSKTYNGRACALNVDLTLIRARVNEDGPRGRIIWQRSHGS